MKALIKGGLFLALGWLAQDAGAQEIKWRASTPKNSATPAAESGIRTVSVGQPTRLGADSGSSSFRPLTNVPAVVRGQAPDDKTVPAFPKLEIVAGDPQPAKPLPKSPGFTPPPPKSITPTPILDSLGFGEDGACGDWCGQLFTGSDCCPERPRFWGSVAYLMWWQRAQNVPPLVTSSPAGQVGGVGVLGDPRTTVLYNEIPNPTRSGGRVALGMWTRHFCNVGLETNFFFLNRQSALSTYGSDGNPQLARPFIDADIAAQDAEIFTPGTASVETYSQIWGIEGNVRHKWRCTPNCWVDVLWGYRHVNLSEGINITEDLSIPIAGAAPLRVMESESFRTRNLFNGFQFGLDGERRLWNRCYIGWTAKVALGNMHQIINIDGSTTFVAPAPIGTVTQQGALLATPTNIGRYTSNRFAVVPEIGVKFGVDVTDHLRVFVGYDFLYMSSVLRPGDQIDLNVSPSYRPTIFGPGVGGGPRVPMVPYTTSAYWAQGFNFGLQYRY